MYFPCDPGKIVRFHRALTLPVLALLLFPYVPLKSPSLFPAAGRSGGTIVNFSLSSTSFTDGSNIPKRFTCDGQDVSPQFSWTAPPPGTKSFALVVDDPDAPVGNWNHWVLWNVPAEAHELAEGVSKTEKLPDGSQQGTNDFGKPGYNGPCPPPGKPHRYYFKLFAMDSMITVKEKARKSDLEAALKGHVLGQAQWMGRYGR